HRPVQGLALPAVGERGAVQNVGDAVGVDGELEGVGPLGAEGALVDGAARVALDVDELARLGVDQLAAADGAVGADALGDGGAAEPRGFRQRLSAERLPGRLRVRGQGKAEHGHALTSDVSCWLPGPRRLVQAAGWTVSHAS